MSTVSNTPSVPVKSRSKSRGGDFFDDQLWPINLVLLILAGFAAGTIVGRGDLNTPEGLRAVWVQLGVLAAVVVMVGLALALLAPRQQRRVQLAALISLLLHLSISEVMQHLMLASTAELPAPVEQGEQTQPVTLPDYQSENPAETHEPLFTKPVDVKLPREVQEELEKLATTPTPAKRPTPVEPKPQPQLEPQPIELARSEVAEPKRADKLQLPERQQPQVRQPEPEMQVTMPQPRQTPAPPTQQQPQVQVAKTANAPQLPERQPTQESPDRPAPTRPQLTPRPAQEKQPQHDPQVAAARRTAPSTTPEAPQVEQPATSASRKAESRPLESNVGDVVRGANAAPQLTPQAPQSSPAALTKPQATAPGRSESRPQVDQFAKLDTSRTLRDAAALNSRVDVPSAASGAPRGAQPATPQPAASSAAKSVNSLVQSAASGGSPSSAPATAPSASVGAPQATRTETSTAGVATTRAPLLARSDTSRADASRGVDAAAVPVTGGPNPDTAGSRSPAPVEVSGAANIGRTSTRAASGQPSTSNVQSPSGAGPVTVAAVVATRPGSSAETPSLNLGSASGMGTMGRSPTQTATVAGTQVVDIPGDASPGGKGGPGGGTTGAGRGAGDKGAAPLSPAVAGASQRGAGSGQPSLAGISPGASPGGGNDPAGYSVAGKSLLAAGSVGLQTATAGGNTAPAVDVAGGGKTLGRSMQPGGTLDLPGSTAVNVPIPGSGNQPNVTTPGRTSTAGSPLAALGPATSNVDKTSDRPGIPAVLPKGTAGTGPAPTIELGQPLRRAPRESDVVSTVTPRMPLERTGGAPAIDGRVRDIAVEGLKQRDREGRSAIAEKQGGNADTERAVELGLDFLARHQAADGSWSLHAFARGRNYANAGEGRMESDTAATGLALLAFLGAGYTHTDGKYRAVVERGLDYLVARQKPNGDLFQHPGNGSEPHVLWYYSHGIASIALCEAYGMTRDRSLQQPAQQALKFILSGQNPSEGGWRYGPRLGSDTSVSGWQLMALKSGELAGLDVPRGAYRLVERWLDRAQGAGGNPSRYAYRPDSDQPDQKEPSHVMTAEALLMRQYSGWRRDNPNMVAGADWIRELLPRYGTPSSRRPYGERDAYYWYYATQVMFQMQGEHWEDWNRNLRSLLVDGQTREGELRGSWDPLRPVRDRWGEDGGRMYVTCLHLLMLEVYYRHLPIYQTLEEGK